MPKSIEKANGLELISLKTSVQPQPPPGGLSLAQVSDLKTLIKTFDATPDYAVFYFDYGIRFAKWEKGSPKFHDGGPQLAYLQLARIFNQQRELKIWRSEEGFAYRLRIDEEGDEAHAIDARQYLWGTRAEHENLPAGWSKLTEDRGVEVIVPLNIKHQGGESRPLARIHTRNYIEYLENGQASYGDCRFVALEQVTKEAGEQ
jgi:CRISPR-associated protein (TIGR03984 family)